MPDAEAEGAFKIDIEQVEAALRDLETHLGALEKKFANAGPGITSHLQGIDAAAQRAAHGLGAMNNAGGQSAGFFARATGGIQGLVGMLTTLSHYTFLIPNSLGRVGVALGNLLGRIHPLGPAFVKAFSDALPAMKQSLHMLGAVDAAGKALSGRLTGLGAVHGFLAARALGVSRAHATMAASAGLAFSTVAGGAGLAGNAIRALAGTAVAATGTVGAAFAAALPWLLPITAALGAMAAGFLALKKVVNVSGQFEQIRIGFTSLIGSAAVAKVALEDVVKFSDSTPFDKLATTGAAKELLAYGVSAAELVPMLRDAGDASQALGRDLGNSVRALGQVKLGNVGIEVLRQLGLTRRDLELQGVTFDANGSYRGSADAALTAVRAAIQQKFGGAMEDASKSWGGLWSILSTRMTTALRAVGEPVMEALKPAMVSMIHFVERLAPWAEQIGILLANMIQRIMPLIEAVMQRLGSMFEFWARIINAVNKAFGFKLPPIPAGRDRERADDGASPLPGGSIEARVGSLRELGGGGAIGLGLAGDPLLAVNERMARSLEQLVDQGRGSGGTPAAPKLPVPYFS